MIEISISRREFLSAAGALAIQVTAAVPVAFGQSGAALPRSIAANPGLDMWVRIGTDGFVTISTGKCELGQGIGTALAQIAADELDVTIERITISLPDTAYSPNEGRTIGSLSIQDSGSAIRVAAAEARGLLLANAARQLNVAPAELDVDDGLIRVRGDTRSISYWQLLGGAQFDTEVSGAYEPKSPASYRYIGQSLPRRDLPAKVFGAESYVQDLRAPGMLHARVVRPPVPPARLLETDSAAVEAMPGVISIVHNGSFLAVVAGREEQAIAAAETLRRNSRWEASRELPSAEEFPGLLHRLESESEVIYERGDEITNDSSDDTRQITADYSRPYIAHASMSPSAALAIYDEDTLTVWSHAQGMFELRGALATILGLPESRIRCIHAQASGCYGQNGADDAACDAAMIAVALPGRPIRLQWSRQDEFRHEPYGSAMSLRVTAQLDSADRVSAWNYDLWSCTHSTRPAGGPTAGNLLAAREKTNPMSEPPRYNMRQPTGGADRNAVALYAFAHQRVTKHFVTDHPLRVSALRGLGAYGNVFAIESFIDELAVASGADPIEFRLRHLEDPRARSVLEALAAQLTTPVEENSEGERVGRGIAFARYKNLGAWLAVAADVAVNSQSGAISVQRAIAVVDAGQIVNPDGVRNQVEGGIVQSTSWTLKEAVAFSGQSIDSVDWARYPILRFTEVPDIEVVLLDRPDAPPLGVGEVAQGPTAAAIANGLAAAADVRLRHLPLTPARVLAAVDA